MRSLANFEASNKKLETAKNKNKQVGEAETYQKTCSTKFEKLSEIGKQGETVSSSNHVSVCVCACHYWLIGSQGPHSWSPL